MSDVAEKLEAMYKPLGRKKFQTFQKVAREDLRELLVHRQTRTRMLRNMTGPRFTNAGQQKELLPEIPLNLLGLFVQVYCQKLAASRPRATVRTEYPEMTPIADDLRVRLDFEADRLAIEDILRETVADSMLGLGVVKIALENRDIEYEGEVLPGSEVFLTRVHADDLLIDVSARSDREVRYIGDRQRLPLDDFLEVYEDEIKQRAGSPEAFQQVMSAIKGAVREVPLENSLDDAANADHISGREGTRDLEDMIEVWDVYFCREKLVVTVLLDQEGVPPLRVREYTGPAHGPYLSLNLGEVPDHILPLPPATSVSPLHELVNHLYLKMAEDAKDQKSVNTYNKGQEDDAEALRKAGRNEFIGVSDADSVKRVEIGGLNRDLFAFTLDARDQFNFIGGNVEALAGLGAQSGTVGQEQLIHASASARVAQMQQRVERFAGKLFESLAFYIWTDPLERTQLTKTLSLPSGESLRIPFQYAPTGELEDLQRLTIRIEPYSMQAKTPEGVVQELLGLLTQFWLPAAGIVMQQGGQIDFRKLNNLIADSTRLHELKEIITFKGQPAEQPKLPPPGQVAKPAMTTRKYVRQDRGGEGRNPVREQIRQMLVHRQQGGE